MNFFRRELDYALAQIEKRRSQFFQVRFRRFILELHDLGCVDHRTTTQCDDLIGLVEIQRLNPLHHDLDLGLRVRNDRDMDVSLLRNVAPNDINVAHMLQSRIGNDDGGARRELPQVLDSVHVEINLIRNPEPHVSLRPPSHALDVEVVINIDVVGSTVPPASPASE